MASFRKFPRPISRLLLLTGFISAVLPLPTFPTKHQETKYVTRAHLFAKGAEPKEVSVPSFSCDDEIHLRIHWQSLPGGKNELEVLWMDARGNIWERNAETIWVSQEDHTFLSDAWFMFRRSMFERFFGYELGKSQKAGTWKVRVRLNGTLMITKKYHVRC